MSVTLIREKKRINHENMYQRGICIVYTYTFFTGRMNQTNVTIFYFGENYSLSVDFWGKGHFLLTDRKNLESKHRLDDSELAPHNCTDFLFAEITQF